VLGPSLDTPFRSPTLAVTVEGLRPDEVCLKLADHNIFAWDGHFYALRATEVLGLVAGGGVTRLGISAYTTSEEIEKVVEVFEGLV
jgi:selenocysteine lyase/cysteine desulfurase